MAAVGLSCRSCAVSAVGLRCQRPPHYVPGNHEARVPEEYRRLKAGLETPGVTVLEDRGVVLSEGEDVIRLIGLSDPNFFGERFLRTGRKRAFPP